MLKVLEQMEFQARSQIVLPMSSRNDIKREWRGVYSAWYTVLHKRCPTHRSSRWLSLSYVMSLLRFREVFGIWKGGGDLVTSALYNFFVGHQLFRKIASLYKLVRFAQVHKNRPLYWYGGLYRTFVSTLLFLRKGLCGLAKTEAS